MNKTRILIIGLLFALTAVTALTTFWLNRPVTLSIVVGPTGSEQSKLVAALAQALARERSSVRLKVVTSDLPDGGLRLDRGDTDLAIVRGDVALPASAQVIAVWQRNPILLSAPADAGIERWTDLPGKTIGVIGRGIGINLRLIDTILREHQVKPEAVRTVEVLPWDVGDAIRQGRVHALVTIGPATFRPVADAIAGLVREVPNGKITLVPIREADAIAERVPFFETAEVVSGAFGSNPLRPTDNLQTLAVNHFLMVRRGVPDAAVAELTQQLFALRPGLAAQNPSALRIEVPETDKGSNLQVHPGALAYLTGDQKTFLDLYSDYIYIAIFLLSLGGSALAAGAGFFGWGRPEMAPSRLPDVIRLIRLVRQADDTDILDFAASEADDIFVEAIGHSQARSIDAQEFSALSLSLDHLRAAIADRRRALAMLDDGETEIPLAPEASSALSRG